MAINRRILYVDNMSAILANNASGVAERAQLLAWVQAKQITGLKWYCQGSSAGGMGRLRTLIASMRAVGIIDHQFVRTSGGMSFDTYIPSATNPATPGTADYGYIGTAPGLMVQPGGHIPPMVSDGLAANDDQRFFPMVGSPNANGSGIDHEREFYNQPTPGTATAVTRQADFLNNWLPSVEGHAAGLNNDAGAYPNTPPNTRKDCAATSYLGWMNAGASTPAICPAIVGTHTRLDLHAYRTTAQVNSCFGYTQGRLQLLADAAALAASNPIFYNPSYYSQVPSPMPTYQYQGRVEFDHLPIFSAEGSPAWLAGGGAAFMFSYYDVNQGNNTFDDAFNTYLTNYQAWNYVNKQYLLEPDGYVIFCYSEAFAARPSLVNP